MGEIVSVNFSGKAEEPKDELREMLIGRFLKTLTETGFQSSVAQRTAQHLADHAIEQWNTVKVHLSFTIGGSLTGPFDDPQAVADAVAAQLGEQYRKHASALAAAAQVSIFCAATGACIVMANSDRLK